MPSVFPNHRKDIFTPPAPPRPSRPLHHGRGLREDGRVNTIVREEGIFMSFDWALGAFAQRAATTGFWQWASLWLPCGMEGL